MNDPFVETEDSYTEEHILELAWELTQDLEDMLKNRNAGSYPWFG